MKKTVLVIDNDTKAASLISKALEAEGYLVFAASSGEAAITMAKKVSPLLIFLNLATPGTNGLEICKAIHSIPVLKDTPLVLLTLRESKFDPRYKSLYGIIGFLKKPFSPEAAVEKTKSALGGGTVPPVSQAEEVFPTQDMVDTGRFDTPEAGFGGSPFGFPGPEEETAPEEQVIRLDAEDADAPLAPGGLEDMFKEEEQAQEEPPAHDIPAFDKTPSLKTPPKAPGAPPKTPEMPRAKAAQTPAPFEETPSPFGETQSPFGNTSSPFGETPSPFGETPSPFGEAQSPFGEGTKGFGGEGETFPGEFDRPGKARYKPPVQKNWMVPALILLAVVVLGAGGYFAYSYLSSRPGPERKPIESAATQMPSMPLKKPRSEAESAPSARMAEAPAQTAKAQPAPKEAPAKPAPVQTAKATPQPTPQPPASPKPAPAGPAFVVQLGVFSSEQNAKALAADAKAKGISASIRPMTSASGKSLFRVMAAEHPAKKQALAEAEAIKAKGMLAAVVEDTASAKPQEPVVAREKTPTKTSTAPVQVKPAPSAPPAQAGAPDKAATSVPAASKPGKAIYLVQFGLFSSEQNAKSLVAELKAKGQDASVRQTTSGGKTMYRVIAGEFGSRKEAATAASGIKSSKNVEAVVTQEAK